MERVTVVLLLVGLVGLGCQTSPFTRTSDDPTAGELPEGEKEGVEAPLLPGGMLPLAVEQRFKDIPLPVDLKEDASRTYVYETPEIQLGRMVYTSRASVNALASFFLEECPVADWEIESVMQADGTKLVMRKPGKRLAIDIQAQGLGRSQVVIINLTPVAEPAKAAQ